MKTNRFLPSPEAQEDAASPETAITLVAGALACAGLGYFGGMQLYEMQGGPLGLPIMFALLGPVLFIVGIYAYAQILTVGDIRAEALEAIEVANEATQNANAMMEKANAYGGLEEEKRTLAEKVRSLEADKRSLELDLQTHLTNNAEISRSLESEKANAKKHLEDAETIASNNLANTTLLHNTAIKTLQNKLERAESKYSLLVDTIGWKRKAQSAVGKGSGSSSDEVKAQAEASKKLCLTNYLANIEAHQFLHDILEKKIEA